MKIAILGYGNLGKGVEAAIKHNPDAQLTAIFTRRDPSAVKPLTAGVNVYNVKDILAHKDEIDVLVLCGGSATDLPEQTPEYAKYFNAGETFIVGDAPLDILSEIKPQPKKEEKADE